MAPCSATRVRRRCDSRPQKYAASGFIHVPEIPNTIKGYVAHVALGPKASLATHVLGLYLPSEDPEKRALAMEYVTRAAKTCKEHNTPMYVMGDMNASYYDTDRPCGMATPLDLGYRAWLRGAGLVPLDPGAASGKQPRAATWGCHRRPGHEAQEPPSQGEPCASSLPPPGHRIDDVLVLSAMMEEETYKASVEVDTPGTAGNSDHEPLRVCLGAHQFYLAPRPPKGDAPEGQQPRTVLKQPINTAEMNIAKDRIRHTHWRKAAQLQSLILESRALAEAALAEWEGGPLDTRVTSILKEGLARRGITAALVDEASAILQEYVVAAYGTLLETCETRTVGRPGGTRPTRKQCRNLDAARQLHRMAKIPYGVLHNLRSNKGGAHPTLEEFTDVLTAHPMY